MRHFDRLNEQDDEELLEMGGKQVADPYSKSQKKKARAQEHNELREWKQRQDELQEKFQQSLRAGGGKSVAAGSLIPHLANQLDKESKGL